jgi:hypothetical protein
MEEANKPSYHVKVAVQLGAPLLQHLARELQSSFNQPALLDSLSTHPSSDTLHQNECWRPLPLNDFLYILQPESPQHLIVQEGFAEVTPGHVEEREERNVRRFNLSEGKN